MKKTLKIIATVVAIVFVFLVIALVSLPLWIGPAVTGAANRIVPEKAGTDFKLDSFNFNPYSGKAEFRGLFLANPKGYDEPVALKVKNVFVDLDVKTVLSETVTINELSIEDVFVSYVFEDGVDNFKRIGDNFSAGGDGVKAATEDSRNDDAAEPQVSGAEKTGEEKKVIIKKLSLSDVKFKYRGLTFPVPSVVLTCIGEKTKGATLCELSEIIINSLINTLGSIGENIGGFASALGDGVLTVDEKTGDALKKFGSKMESVLNDKNLEKLDDNTKKTVELLKGLFK
jgi:hypothetical protein